jgi:hypothetical protein
MILTDTFVEVSEGKISCQGLGSLKIHPPTEGNDNPDIRVPSLGFAYGLANVRAGS